MNRERLLAYPLEAELSQEESALLNDLRPIFRDLLSDAAAMPELAPPERLLSAFRTAMLRVNEHEEAIETVEREAILKIFYEIGTIVGLPAATQFAEEWRGDW